MLNINPILAVDSLVKQGLMIKINGNILFDSAKSHCIILLNKNPVDDDYFVFVCVSSQYLKRLEQNEKRGLPSDTVVMIRPNEYHHLPKYTAIDCNYTYAITKSEFITLYTSKKVTFYKENHLLNKEHLKALIKGVKSSPLVIGEIKSLL